MMCVSIHVLLDHGLCRNLPFGLQVICFRVIGFASFLFSRCWICLYVARSTIVSVDRGPEQVFFPFRLL